MIHQYKLGGYNIVLDVCSGSVHVVDEVAYDVIKEFENPNRDEAINTIYENHKDKATKEEIVECFADVDELKSEGKLFSEDGYEGKRSQ